MIQCQSCHYQGLGQIDLTGHLRAVHGFGEQGARIEAARVAGTPYTDDERVFGKDAWVYCRQHMKAHETGWCGVSPRDKVGLGVTTAEAATAKCREWGFELYYDLYPNG
jgi:hypothetical protein